MLIVISGLSELLLAVTAYCAVVGVLNVCDVMFARNVSAYMIKVDYTRLPSVGFRC